jgi:tetratricopeptide (TPR) repeat protein
MMQTIRTAMAPFMLRFPTPRARGRNVGLQEEHPLFMGQAGSEQQVVDQAPLQMQWCSLWMGRMMHFKGIYTSEGAVEGALGHYIEVMVKDSEVEDFINKFVQAAGLRDEALVQQFRASMREVIPLAKQNATYWLGLIAQDRGNLSTSVDFLERAANPEVDGPWVYGANYNLARTYEQQAAAAKDPQEARELLQQAIKLLEEDNPPQALGNRQRAKWLQSKLSPAESGS